MTSLDVLSRAAVASPPGEYVFREAGAATFPIKLTAEQGAVCITWPPAASFLTSDTTVLEVDVATEPLGDAFVDVGRPEVQDRQYFPPRMSGRAWLNLSSLQELVRPNGQVRLSLSGMKIADQSGTLRLFAARPDLSSRLLVVAPHPDDAEIASFGLYADRNAVILTITAGNGGLPSYEALFDNAADMYRFKGQIRAIDSVTVPWHGAIPPDRCFNLGYFDSRLADMFRSPDSAIAERHCANTDVSVYRAQNLGALLPKGPRRSSWRNLVDDLEMILRTVEPSVIVGPHPQLDDHADHQLTTVALGQALQRWNHEVALLLYANHADGNRYPYGPAGSIASLPRPTRRVDVDRVYSHATAPDLQRRKLFAIEAMHDIRLSPTRQYQLAVGDDRTNRPEARGPEPYLTYLRRGPRANELFFVYDQASLFWTINPLVSRSTKRRQCL